MKPVIAALALSLGLTQMAQAGPIIICDGTYVASQKMLSGMGHVIQGGRNLGPVQIKVLECGAKITISAQGMTIPLTRTSETNAQYYGTFQTPQPLLKFSLAALTPRTIGGTMVASDGELTINRQMALMLKSGKTPNLEGCFQSEPVPLATNYIELQNAMLQTLAGLGKSGATPASYASYIKNITKVDPRNNAQASYTITFHLDGTGNILPRISPKDLQDQVCGGGKTSDKSPSNKLEFAINQIGGNTQITARVINIATGEVIEVQEVTSAGIDGASTSSALSAAWAKIKFNIGNFNAV